MKVAADSGALVTAHAGSARAQMVCAQAIEGVLADDVLVLSTATMAEFVSRITDPEQFANPPSIEAAADVCNQFASAANVEVVEIGDDDFVAGLALLREHDLGVDALDDAVQSARLRRLGVSRLLTTDPARYEHFDFVEPIDPTAA